ncbi:MAG: TIM barrel protein [Dehalococcoidia bacterium]|nr:TIM barrel protein [Dehalococcoidia bacterium]
MNAADSPAPGNEAPPPPSLSTMWAVQPRFERDLHAFLERAAELGFRGVEINHSMDAEQTGAILGIRSLEVTGVHAPAPLERHATYGWNRGMNLASTDEEERRIAVEQHLRSVDLATEAGARHVVVHLGGHGKRLLEGERRLRSMYPRRAELGEEWARTVDATLQERAALGDDYLERARRSLDTLAERAEQRGVTIGLECRLHFHEIPSPEEALDLLGPYPVRVAGYLHDVGHAEVQHRLGLVDRSTWFDLLGDRLVGLHLHDVRGLVDHRAPGNGDVDFEWLATRVNATAARTFEVDQHEPDEDVARGLEVLRAAGVVR